MGGRSRGSEIRRAMRKCRDMNPARDADVPICRSLGALLLVWVGFGRYYYVMLLCSSRLILRYCIPRAPLMNRRARAIDTPVCGPAKRGTERYNLHNIT